MQVILENIDVSEETKAVWQILEQVPDPEVPVLSVCDLGIIRNVEFAYYTTGGEVLLVTITPTYTGCPAMDMIAMNIRLALIERGYKTVEIKTILSPAWTTDWMTAAGKQKLKDYGIAPPVGKSISQQSLADMKIECPQCASQNTRLASEFGSTACKALFVCNDCKEPFDYFKCH